MIWDESRLAVNALEMHLRGRGLITTYGFAPDLWNTKPPLAIWLMAASMRLFGTSEWALRLPSNLAALATLALVVEFCRRTTGSWKIGALAAVILTLSLGFFGHHGARTGDYDALLCLFTTAYLMVLFFALHRRRPQAWRPLLAGGLIACAVMTKSVAGLVPGVGVAIYLLILGRWRRPLQSPWWAPAAALAILPPAAYYALREAAAPGYLAAVWANDVSGRYRSALEAHAGPPWYHLYTMFLVGLFSGAPVALAAPFALAATRGRARLALSYSLCVVGGLLAVVSLSATKLPQYALSAYPFAAIASAIALQRLWRAIAARGKFVLIIQGVVCVVAAALVAKAFVLRYLFLPSRDFYPQAYYGRLLDALLDRDVRDVVVVEGGAPGAVAPGYAPQLRYYALLAERRGLRTQTFMTLPPASARPMVLASCDPRWTPTLRALGADLAKVGGCVAVRRGGTPGAGAPGS